ncbi:MAG: hypothetical protein ACRDJW_03995 [Thermomicrobiales bacterium]
MRRLEIFVTPECLGCPTAFALADSVRARAIPLVEVHVTDLSAPGAERPDAVFAVPTYLLDGQVLSLGNPDEEWLVARLTGPANGRGADESRPGDRTQ